MRIGAGAEKDRRVVARLAAASVASSRAHGPLVEPGGSSQRRVLAQRRGDVREELVDRRRADRGEHRRDVGVGMGREPHPAATPRSLASERLVLRRRSSSASTSLGSLSVTFTIHPSP